MQASVKPNLLGARYSQTRKVNLVSATARAGRGNFCPCRSNVSHELRYGYSLLAKVSPLRHTPVTLKLYSAVCIETAALIQLRDSARPGLAVGKLPAPDTTSPAIAVGLFCVWPTLKAWLKQFPVSAWEDERNQRIAKRMRHANPFVAGARQWTQGHNWKEVAAYKLRAGNCL